MAEGEKVAGMKKNQIKNKNTRDRVEVEAEVQKRRKRDNLIIGVILHLMKITIEEMISIRKLWRIIMSKSLVG